MGIITPSDGIAPSATDVKCIVEFNVGQPVVGRISVNDPDNVSGFFS